MRTNKKTTTTALPVFQSANQIRGLKKPNANVSKFRTEKKAKATEPEQIETIALQNFEPVDQYKKE